MQAHAHTASRPAPALALTPIHARTHTCARPHAHTLAHHPTGTHHAHRRSIVYIDGDLHYTSVKATLAAALDVCGAAGAGQGPPPPLLAGGGWDLSEGVRQVRRAAARGRRLGPE